MQMRWSSSVSVCCLFVFSLFFLGAATLPGEAAAKGVVRLYQIHDSESSPLLLLLDQAFSSSTDVYIDWYDATSLEKSVLFQRVGEGEADALLTNDASLVDELEKKEWARSVQTVMSNQLFLAGPEADPAGASGLPLKEAFRRIADTNSLFISPLRGGWFTVVEAGLWRAAGVTAPETLKGYISSGRNRLAAMIQAGEEGGYILTDPSTFAVYEASSRGQPSSLKSISSRIDGPDNRYFFVVVERGILGSQRVKNAEVLSDWLVSDQAKQIISGYALSGHHPFVPWSEGR